MTPLQQTPEYQRYYHTTLNKRPSSPATYSLGTSMAALTFNFDEHTGEVTVNGQSWHEVPQSEKSTLLKTLSASQLLKAVASDSRASQDIQTMEDDIASYIVRVHKQALEDSMTSFDYWHLSLLDALKHWLEHKDLWIIDGFFRAADFVRWYNGFQVFLDYEPVDRYVQNLVHIYIQAHTDISVMADDVERLTEMCRAIELPTRARANRSHDSNNDVERIKNGYLGS
ncbi:uncharacterized protein LTR77_010683 [Saxophila tyrrhenica]|uniref:Uncharacterized protein n=1 Tax=Saxophila tyrrhenica TaxID=1690608 RepID=A0AAV9NXF6_9PEZI|nr:hypothetical protein LTR77_010683 [Saxophila tyrrhenica]